MGAEYIKADRDTFEAITPDYLRYVENDATLDAEAKKARVLVVKSWDRRLDEAEKVGDK